MARPRDPQRRALASEADALTKAAEVTPDDIAAVAAQAPASVRKYLLAQPMPEDDDTGSDDE